MLKGLIETGAGPSVMGITAWKSVGLKQELHSKRCNLLAVNGNPITTYGIADSVKFNVARINLENNFIIVLDLHDEDFILGKTFIRSHIILLDLNQSKMKIRRPDPKPLPVVPEDASAAAM